MKKVQPHTLRAFQLISVILVIIISAYTIFRILEKEKVIPSDEEEEEKEENILPTGV